MCRTEAVFHEGEKAVKQVFLEFQRTLCVAHLQFISQVVLSDKSLHMKQQWLSGTSQSARVPTVWRTGVSCFSRHRGQQSKLVRNTKNQESMAEAKKTNQPTSKKWRSVNWLWKNSKQSCLTEAMWFPKEYRPTAKTAEQNHKRKHDQNEKLIKR